MWAKVLILSLVGCFGFVLSGSAQDPESIAYLQVQSNLPSSLVLVDSSYAGRANGDILTVVAGAVLVSLAPQQVGSWDLDPPSVDTVLFPGDTTTLILDFPYMYRIDSDPFGAVVSVPAQGDRILGKTPLIYSSAIPIVDILLLERSGYVSERVTPGSDVINRHAVAMRPLVAGASPTDAVEWNPRISRNTWINWAAGALAIGGGALAAHFKFKADEEYELYLESGDPEIKESVDRYDRYSYVALGTMQVGIGILVYRVAF